MSVLRHLAPVSAVALGLIFVSGGVASAAPDRPVPDRQTVSHEHYATHPLHIKPSKTTAPSGLSPAAVKAAYGFPTSLGAGAGTTIAIVDAYNDPNIEADLGVFSTQYALPNCTTSNGCFTKADQAGGTAYPKTDGGWSQEIALDVEWAHAIAPGAKILLVEAASSSFTDLMAAEDYASAHARYVSNSWGGSEFATENSYDIHFSHAGVSYFASSGDNGAGVAYPAASPNVVAVGGTTLHYSGSTLTGETAWSGSGGGCSVYEAASSAQQTFSTYGQVNCTGKRAVPDVSLDADPASGVSVYDSVSYGGHSGWLTFGGTSASSPMWAARSADTGSIVNSSAIYGSAITYRDITSGSNGYSALSGFDLVTGRGSRLG